MTTCVLCGIRCPPEADAVEAGGDVGRVHFVCFESFDRDAEQAELGGMMVEHNLVVDEVAA